jgi:hypothetical protein
MSATVSRLPGLRRRGGLTAATAAVLGLLAPVAALADEPTQRFEVDGRVVYRIADPASHEEGEHFEEGSVTTAYAEVDGAMIDLSAVQAPTVGGALQPADGLPAGAEVLVTLEAPAGLGEAEAVALAAGTDVAVEGETAPADGATAATAQVVDAVATEVPPVPADLPTAAAVAGVQQLVVVPVRWAAADPVPTADLQTAATGTEQYWERQSAGRIDLRTSVRAAVTVTRPATCDVDRIMSQVVSSTGLNPTPTNHVAVHFPEHAGCDFAGLATINGGAIWLNGAAHTYVLAHELGHNLGLGHANTLHCTAGGKRVPLTATGDGCLVDEYGDNTDVMGQGRNLSSPGNLSSGFARHLGWAGFTAISTPAVGPTTVDLTPLSQNTGVRGIRIGTDLGPVFTDYRPAVGPDALHEPGWAGVQSRLVMSDPVYRYPTSYLLDLQPSSTPFANPSLPVGKSWTVAGPGLKVTTVSTGATARVTVAPTAVPQVERYVVRVYQDLFHRAPDAAGLRHWAGALNAGTPRSAVAASITSSDEYRARLIAGTYQTYLGRSPDQAGAASWLQAMRAGATVQDIESGFVASDEYYLQSGRTNAGWVTRLYQHVLGRNPQAAEVRHWTGELASGWSRHDVAMGFLLSTEHLTTVVDGYYVDLLDRNIDASGRRTWVEAIQRGARVETIIGEIVASEEYFGRV